MAKTSFANWLKENEKAAKRAWSFVIGELQVANEPVDVRVRHSKKHRQQRRHVKLQRRAACR